MNRQHLKFLSEGERSLDKPGWFLQWFTTSGVQEIEAGYCVVHRCANGHDGTLGKNHHKIMPDGTVNPNVVCNRQGCRFHEWVKLEGWEEPENARRIY